MSLRYVLLINSAGNVELGDVENDVRMPIGEPLRVEQQSRVISAAWSPGGRWTAWSVGSDAPDGVREIRLHDEETDTSGTLTESLTAFYLCPSPCGKWLSHLSPGPLGLELAISNIRTGEIQVAERGQPLFWSWSPDGSQLAVHVENRLIITRLGEDTPRTVTDEAGPFISPWWLAGGSVAYAIDDRIVSVGPDDAVNTLVSGGSAGRFAPDPEGRRLAYLRADRDNNSLVVLDLLSGEETTVTSSPIAGFFWSPDGSRLAALAARGEAQVEWVVFDGEQARPLPPFRPTRTWAGSVLPFFEQYAQSHAHWSIDSTALIACAVDDGGSSGALIQRVQAPHDVHWMPDAELAWWA